MKPDLKTDWKVFVCIQVDYIYDDAPDDGWDFLNDVQADLVASPDNVELLEVEPIESTSEDLDDGTIQIATENAVLLSYEYLNLTRAEVLTSILADFLKTHFEFTDPLPGVWYSLSQVQYWAFYDVDNPNYEPPDFPEVEPYQFDEEIFPNFVFYEESEEDFAGAHQIWEFTDDFAPIPRPLAITKQ